MELAYLFARSSSYEVGQRIGRILGIFLFPVLLMLLFGTINYVLNHARDRQITFKQAILAKWVVISSVILWLFGLFGQLSKFASSG